MENNTILIVAVILMSGLLLGRLVKMVNLPNVTGYLIAGLLLGPSFTGFMPMEMVNSFSVISEIALAFIAFSIGNEFSLKYLKKVGISPLIIAIAESFGAIILVMASLILLGIDARLAIMLGAIAAATAPAQTIMVIKQYKAKGTLTSMLLSVVALDDAVALIGFGFAATVVNIMSSHLNTSILFSVLSPVYEVLISFVIGAVLSVVMKILFRYFRKQTNRICIIVSIILFTYFVAEFLHGSSLLACMALGGVFVNIYEDIDEIIKISERFTPPFYMVFFVISGAGFEISALKGIGFIGLIYVVMRVVGKITGAWFGGKITKQESKICKYLGPTLMPQAGVALGLIVIAASAVPEYAAQIRVIVLCSTFIYSIIGPVAAKMALQRSGEIVIAKKQ